MISIECDIDVEGHDYVPWNDVFDNGVYQSRKHPNKIVVILDSVDLPNNTTDFVTFWFDKDSFDQVPNICLDNDPVQQWEKDSLRKLDANVEIYIE